MTIYIFKREKSILEDYFIYHILVHVCGILTVVNARILPYRSDILQKDFKLEYMLVCDINVFVYL